MELTGHPFLAYPGSEMAPAPGWSAAESCLYTIGASQRAMAAVAGGWVTLHPKALQPMMSQVAHRGAICSQHERPASYSVGFSVCQRTDRCN